MNDQPKPAQPSDGNGQHRVIPEPTAPYSGLAIAAMVCGICGFITWGISGIVGIVLALKARHGTQYGGKRGEGMRVAGFVCGIVSASLVTGCVAIAVFSTTAFAP